MASRTKCRYVPILLAVFIPAALGFFFGARRIDRLRREDLAREPVSWLSGPAGPAGWRGLSVSPDGRYLVLGERSENRDFPQYGDQ